MEKTFLAIFGDNHDLLYVLVKKQKNHRINGWKLAEFLPIGKYDPDHLSHTWMIHRTKHFFSDSPD